MAIVANNPHFRPHNSHNWGYSDIRIFHILLGYNTYMNHLFRPALKACTWLFWLEWPHCDLTGIKDNQGNHPQMTLFLQVCSLFTLWFRVVSNQVQGFFVHLFNFILHHFLIFMRIWLFILWGGVRSNIQVKLIPLLMLQWWWGWGRGGGVRCHCNVQISGKVSSVSKPAQQGECETCHFNEIPEPIQGLVNVPIVGGFWTSPSNIPWRWNIPNFVG